MVMLGKYRKQLIISFIIVFLFFFVLFFSSSIYFKLTKKKASIKVDYHTTKILKLRDLLPVSDTLGKSFTGSGTVDGVQGYVEFSVKNLSDKKATYEVYITEQDDFKKFTKIRGNYIKFYLTNENDAPFSGFENKKLPTYNELPVLVDKPEGKLLYRGSLEGEKTENCKLRVWLSDSYAVSYAREEKEFIVKVNVRSI